MPSAPQNQSLQRAAAVLEAIGSAPSGMLRASDVARAVGLGASTTGRLLATLETLGFVRRASDGYAIGAGVLELASHGLNHEPVHRESRAAAQELAHRVGLTANVGVRDGDRCIYLCHFEGALAPKSHTMIGMPQPLHASAMGKCLLLDLAPEERRSLLGDTLDRFTDRTLTDHAELDRDLETAQARGWCTEEQELALGRSCVGAPIRGSDGRVVAALTISGRGSDFRSRDRDALVQDLIEVADRISVGLGLITAVPRPVPR